MTPNELLSTIAPDLATLPNKDGAIYIADSQAPQCKNRDLAVAYLAAHILATSKTNGAGAVSGMSEGALSLSFATSGNNNSLSSTSYGNEYLRLTSACIFTARTRIEF